MVILHAANSTPVKPITDLSDSLPDSWLDPRRAELWINYQFDAKDDIETFRPLDVNPFTPDVGRSDVNIAYVGGATTELPPGSISFGSGRRTNCHAKSGGMIYPIDESGILLLNATNTPRLVAMRHWHHEQANLAMEQNLAMAELVYVFAGAVAHLGNAAGHLGR